MKFEKKYTSEEDELYRREIWEKNVAYIDLHNKEFKEGKHTYTLAENKFSDMVHTILVQKQSICIRYFI